MLDQLVESKSNTKENARRSGFFATTFITLVAILLGTLIYSLFAKDYNMDSGDLGLEALVAPVPVPEEAPPPPPEKQPEQQKAAPNADVRKEVIQAMDESPKPPDKVSVEKQTIPPRRANVLTVQGDTNLNARDAVDSSYKGPVSTNNKGIAGNGGEANGENQSGGEKPPAPPPPPAPKPKPVPKTISGGVLNGKATSLPQPAYPPAAKAVRAGGTVTVQVKIDEAGNVVSASAVSGHPLLKAAAEQAARRAKFSPTMLSGQAVSVTGIITYNFIL
ncbi:MAG: energy transducer TonB [Acidobacteriota bacterium]|nr:energy transducer TonB [Acidobacteriota bacterium]